MACARCKASAVINQRHSSNAACDASEIFPVAAGSFQVAEAERLFVFGHVGANRPSHSRVSMSEMSSYSTNGLLSEREHLVMLAILRLSGREYAVAIREEIEARTGILLRRGGVYEALERLERAGYLTSATGLPTAERGGHATRLFSVTVAGAAAIDETERVIAAMRRSRRTLREGR